MDGATMPNPAMNSENPKTTRVGSKAKSRDRTPLDDPVEDMADRLRAMARKSLPEEGKTHARVQRIRIPQRFTFGSWGANRGGKRVFTPQDVLMNNVRENVEYPVGLVIKTNAPGMREMSEMSADDLREYPLEGFRDNGVAFPWMPEQLAIIMRLCNTCPSSVRITLDANETAFAVELARERERVRLPSSEANETALAAMGHQLTKEEKEMNEIERLAFDARSATRVRQRTDYTKELDALPDCDAFPNLDFFVAPPGCGKTAITLAAVMHGLCRRWGRCRDNFNTWSALVRMTDPQLNIASFPKGRTLRRAAIVVVPDATLPQWINTARNMAERYADFYGCTLNIWPGDGRYARTSGESFASLSETDATVMIINYDTFSQFLREHLDLGVMYIVCDEISSHIEGMNAAYRPLVWRMVCVTAKPFDAVKAANIPNQNNLMRNILFDAHRATSTREDGKKLPRADAASIPQSVEDLLVHGERPKNQVTMRFLERMIAKDVALPLRASLVDECVRKMQRTIREWVVPKLDLSFGAVSGALPNDLARVPWSEVEPTFYGTWAKRNEWPAPVGNFLRASDVAAAHLAAIATDVQRVHRRIAARRGPFIKLTEIVGDADAAALRCNACAADLGHDMVNRHLSLCCVRIFCTACVTSGKATQCACTAVPPAVGAGLAESSAAASAPEIDRRLNALCAAPKKYARPLLAAALAAALTDAAPDGTTRAIVFAPFPTAGAKRSSARAAVFESFLESVRAGAGDADVLSVVNSDGGMRPRHEVAEIRRRFELRDGTKLVLLLDSSANPEHVTVEGLDLSNATAIVSVGHIPCPDQAFMRAVRISEQPHDHLNIVRLL